MKKKLLCALCALLSMVCLTTGVLAADEFADFRALLVHWNTTEWPDWACCYSSTDGSAQRLTVVVNSREGEEQLRKLVADESTMTVIVSETAWTERELQKVADAIDAEYSLSREVWGACPEMDLDNGFGESGKELRVVVRVVESRAEEYRKLFREKYGDMVYVKAVKADQSPIGDLLDQYGPGPDGKFTDIGTLFQYWGTANARPDWVCAVSSTDGGIERLTVVINSAAAEETLRGMLADDSTLTVVVSEGGYSETQLLRVMDEISDKYFGSGELSSICVGWTTIDGKVTGFGESGLETRVVVGVLPEHVEKYRKELEAQYGDMVYVEAREFADTYATGITDNIATGVLREEMGLQQPKNQWYLWGLAVLLCGFVMLALYRYRTVAVRTADGRTVTAQPPMTARQVEETVASTAETPAEQIHRDILKKLQENPKN